MARPSGFRRFSCHKSLSRVSRLMYGAKPSVRHGRA
jgi:hypothetical protein